MNVLDIDISDGHSLMHSMGIGDTVSFRFKHESMRESFALGDRCDLVVSTDQGETDLSTHPPRFSPAGMSSLVAEVDYFETDEIAIWVATGVNVTGGLETVFEEYDPSLVEDDVTGVSSPQHTHSMKSTVAGGIQYGFNGLVEEHDEH